MLVAFPLLQSKRRRVFAAALAAGVGLSLGSQVQAASSDTWVGNDSVNWSDSLDWLSGLAPASGDSLNFGAAGTSGTALNDNLGAGFSLGGITFLNGASAYTFSTNNASSIDLGAGGITNSSTSLETISNINLVLTSNLTDDTAYGNEAINSVISGTYSLLKSGSGTLILTGANTYTGVTTIGATSTGAGTTQTTGYGGGTLDLNFGAAGAPTSNILYNGATAGQVNFGGGTLEIDGATGAANTQTLGTLNLTAGFSTIDLNPGSSGTVTLTTGTWTAPSNVISSINALAGQMNLVIPTGASITTTQGNASSPTAVSGVLSFGGLLSNVTVNSTSWAERSGGQVIGLPTSSYFASTTTKVGTAAQATDIVTNVSLLIAADTTNSLRFNTAANDTLSLYFASLVLDGGGILMTPNVGANTETINEPLGGYIEGAPNAGLTIFQYDTQGKLVINLPIENNGNANALTIGGGGTVSLGTNGVNTFTGNTNINGGTLAVVQDSNFGAVATGAAINIDGGTLQAGATFSLYNSATTGLTGVRNIGIGSMGATFDVTSTFALTVPGNITSQNIAGAGNLTKTDTGILILSGTDAYYGNTTVTGGTLELASAGALPGGVGASGGTSALVINGGIVGLGTGATTFNRGVGLSSSQVQWTGSGGFAAYSSSGATVNFGGANAVVKWNTNGFVPTGSTLVLGTTAANGSVTISNPIDFNGAVQNIQATGTVPIAGILSGALSDGGFNKVGTGVLELTGTSTYTGATNINAGTLLLGSGGSLGNTAVTVNSGGILTTKGTTSAITGIVTLPSGGAINLENASPGDILSLGGLNLTGGGAIDFDLSSTNHVGDSLALIGGGTITNSGLTTLNFADTSTAALTAGNTYTLATGVPSTAASDFVYNPNQFSSLALSVGVSGTSLVLTVSSTSTSTSVEYWKGGVDSVWSDASNGVTNWVNSSGAGVGLPGAGNQVVFSYSGGATNQASTTIGAVTAVDSLVINDPTNLTIGGTGTLTLGPASSANGISLASTAGTDTISVTGLALGKAQTWSNASPNLLTVSSIISGTVGLTISSSGTGDILLTGANTYSGPTTITAGTLQVGNASALGTGSTTINGGALDLDGHALTLKGIIGSGGAITDSVTTLSTLTDTLASGTTVTYAGSINNGSGTVALTTSGSGIQILTGGSNTFTGGTTISGTSTLVIGDGVSNIGSLAGNVTDNHTLVFNTPTSDTINFAGNISGSGSVVASGAGTVELSGTDTNTAGATVNLGTLQMGSSTALSSVPLTLANATVDLHGFSPTITTLTTASTAVNAVITNSSTAAAVSTMTVTAGGNYYGTIIDGPTPGNTALTLTGGTLALFNAGNSFTGPTTINGGVLSLKSGGSLGNTAVAINSTGALAASGLTSKVGGIVTVNTGGAINLENGVATDVLTLGGLSLAGGGALDFDLSATSGINDSLAFSAGGTFTNVGTTALNFASVGTLVAGNTYTLISGATGIAASDFTYNTNTFPNLSLDVTTIGSNLVVSVQGPPPPPTIAEWEGTVDSVWSDTSGSTTNWVDPNGVGVALPTSITHVVFSYTGATRQASTTIGAISAVDSIEINDPTNLTIGGSTSTLTLEGLSTGSGIMLDSTAGTDVISVKNIALGNAQTWSNNSPNLLTVSSVVSGTTGDTLTINSTGTGAILLAGADTFTAGLTLTAGTLKVGSTTALGTGSPTINGGTLDLNGHNITISKGIGGSGGTITDSSATASTITDSIASGTTVAFAGSITNGSGSVALSLTGAGVQALLGSGNTFTGGTTIGTTSTLDVGDGVSNPGSLSGNVADSHILVFDTPASSTVTYTGNVSGSGSIVIFGPGTTNLAGDDTMTSGATVSNGILQMGSNTGLDDIPLTLANATFDLNSYSPTISTLTTASTATSAVITNSNPAAVSTLTVAAGGSYYGVISDGAIGVGGQTALTITGATMSLYKSTSTYTGATTINGGILSLQSGASLGNTAVAVNNNGTLTTSGATSAITGSVTVNTGGALDLRNGVAGDTLTIGTLALAGGGSLGFDVNATSNVSDSLNITNFSSSGTTALNFTEIGTLPANADFTYTLISGGTGISATDFSYNSTVTSGTNSYNAYLSAPGGTSLVLTIAAAPPPPPFAYWQGGIDNVWSDGTGMVTNWVDVNGVGVAMPGGPTQVIFSSTVGTVANEASTTLGSITAMDSLTMNTATSLTIGGAGTVTILAAATGNGIVANSNAGADTINIAGISLGGAQTWSNNSNNLLTVSSNITGGPTDTLTIDNSGTADILLTGASTFTGGVIIADGTLQIGSSTALGDGALTVNGGTLDLNGQSVVLAGISGSGGLITDSTNTYATVTSSLATGNTMTFAGNITNGAGVVNIDINGTGLQILTGTANTYSGGTTIGLGASLQIGDGMTSAGSLTGNTADNGSLIFSTPASNTITYSGNTSGTFGIISQNGAGTVVLSGNNTEGLGVVIDSGEVQMGSSTGINTIPVTMDANSTLDLNSYNITAYSISAAAAASSAVITNSGPNSSTTTLTVTEGGTYNGEINTGINDGQVALAVPSGTLILTNLSSTYAAGTTITGGEVEAGNGTTPTSGFEPYTDDILGTGFVTVTNGTLDLNSQATASSAVGLQFNFTNSISLNGGATLISASGINSLNGPLAINGTGNAIQVTLAQMPLILAGTLSGTGSVTISGSSSTNPSNVEFNGSGTNFIGNITLNAATAQLFIGSNIALLNANLSINGNDTATNSTTDFYFPDNIGSAIIFAPATIASNPSIGSLSSVHKGDGNIILATSDGQSPVFLTIGNNNGNSNYSGILSDVPSYPGATSLGGGITKVGTGSLTLSGANTFSGGVTISNGTLVAADTVSSATASSTGTGNVTLTGGVLASLPAATSYVLGAVVAGNVNSNTIAPGGVGTIGTLSIGGLTTSSLTTLSFDLGTGSGVVTNGDILTLGSGTVSIGSGTAMSFGGTPVSGDDYALIGDTSSGAVVGAIPLGNFTLPPAPAGLTYTLGLVSGYIDLEVSGSATPASLTWNNSSSNHLWDKSSSVNWNNGTGNAVYSDGSAVTFNDNNPGPGGTSANYAVTLNTIVSPASVSVNNSAGNYTISGTGSIAGTGSLTKSGTGTLVLETANAYSGGTVVNAGALVIEQTSSTTSALATGAVSITGGELQLASNVTAGSQSSPTPSSNVVITSLSITGAGVLDITNNHIIINYGSGPDPISSIVAMIKEGYSGGTWTGDGITSSMAQANSGSYGIGYADSADHNNPVGLASGEIEIAYTLLGDANLDGKVNGSDFTLMAANFNDSVTNGWDEGDFNFSNTVNGDDFVLLADNFNQYASQSAIAAADLSALDNFAAANGISLTSVPEPASTGLLTLGVLGVMARRRRKTNRL